MHYFRNVCSSFNFRTLQDTLTQVINRRPGETCETCETCPTCTEHSIEQANKSIRSAIKCRPLLMQWQYYNTHSDALVVRHEAKQLDNVCLSSPHHQRLYPGVPLLEHKDIWGIACVFKAQQVQ